MPDLVDSAEQVTLGVDPPREGDSSTLAGNSIDTAYSRVRDAILYGELPAGAVVSQARLMELSRVGRTPLREAIRLLQREGLMDIRRNHRPRVSELSWLDLEELYAIRISIETGAAYATVPHLGAREFRALRAELIRFGETVERDGIEKASRHHRAFHLGLTAGVGKRTRRYLHDLWDHSERYRRLFFEGNTRLESAQAEHHAILDACERQQPGEAAQLLARHLARTALAVLAEKAPEHDPALIRSTLHVVARGGEGSS